MDDVIAACDDQHIGTIEIRRPPNNFLDTPTIAAIADGLCHLADRTTARVVVIRSAGKHFSAGRDFSKPRVDGDLPGDMYREAARIATSELPIIAAVQGAAVGAGLGLAMIADFRVATPHARFDCSFARLGYHQGFGLSVTLPAAVGHQRALEILLKGQRIGGEEALAAGLCDRLANEDDLWPVAHAFALEFAASAPLSLRSIRRTMRDGLHERFVAATERELSAQSQLADTEDFREGLASSRERRSPHFIGR